MESRKLFMDINIGVIGCGVMGSAMARYFVKDAKVFLYNRHPDKAKVLALEIKATVCCNLQELCQRTDYILLAVKPQQLEEIGGVIGHLITSKQVVLSILAGITLSSLRKVFPKAINIRLMPNLPLVYGKGMMGLVKESTTPQSIHDVLDILFNKMGSVAYLAEEQVNPFTALVGSGPAFVVEIFAALMEKGIDLGFTYKEAKHFMLETFSGALELIQHMGISPKEIVKRVASPGGVTEAGLRVINEKKLSEVLGEMIEVSVKRSHDLDE